MRRKIGFSLGLIGLLASSQAALAGQYKVEVLVFTQNVPSTEVLEKSPSPLKPPQQVSELGVVNDVSQSLLAVEPLSGLKSAYEQLSQQATYTILVNTAWIQSAEENQALPAVHLQNSDTTLNGYITLKAAKSLSINVDVAYSNASNTIRINQKTSLKLNEPYYFDHPAIGVITLVTAL